MIATLRSGAGQILRTRLHDVAKLVATGFHRQLESVADLRRPSVEGDVIPMVHLAEAHAREWPDSIQEAAMSELDPDKRILAMLSARGKALAKVATASTETLRSA